MGGSVSTRLYGLNNSSSEAARAANSGFLGPDDAYVAA